MTIDSGPAIVTTSARDSGADARSITVAILGCDEDVLEVARALREAPRFHVVGVFDAEPLKGLLRAALPGVPLSDAWETLLVAGPDVVLVGSQRSVGQADDQLRKLVQAGVPLLMTQPPCEALVALELEMIRRDSQAPLAVYYPGCRHAARDALVRIAADSTTAPLGNLEQVLIERFLADRSRDVVTRQFARDVHWLQAIVGDVRQVSALGTGLASDDAANLSVQMTTATGRLVRWSVHPRTERVCDTVELVGTQARVGLQMPATGEDWKLASAAAGETTFPAAVPTDALKILSELSRAGKSPRPSAVAAADPEDTDWARAVRAMEVLDSVLVSLKRGRTIELQKTQLSEQQTFKGLMSAVGCLLLLVAPLILIGAAVIDRLQASFRPRAAIEQSQGTPAKPVDAGGSTSAADPATSGESAELARRLAKPRPFPWLGVALAAPLVIFLLLQTLQLVFHRPTRTKT